MTELLDELKIVCDNWRWYDPETVKIASKIIDDIAEFRKRRDNPQYRSVDLVPRGDHMPYGKIRTLEARHDEGDR